MAPIWSTVLVMATISAAAAAVIAGQQQPAAPRTTFRSGLNMVLVDVIVRDRHGAVVRGLSTDDFMISEDGRPQEIRLFNFEEIALPASGGMTAPLLAGAGQAGVASGRPLRSEDVAGRRLWVLLFDTASMQWDELEKATQSALKFVDLQMTSADLVAVATVGSSLQVVSDFTSDRAHLRDLLRQVSIGTSTSDATDTTTGSSDATSQESGGSELDALNNDVRLRALRTLAEGLSPLQQKKAILYFSSGMQRQGSDNQIELRSAVNAANRANVAIYPVDARGVQAMVPGGSARTGSTGGVASFSGRGMADQFTQLAEQQETLSTLASDTGGTAFTDTNDFGEAFNKVVRDITAYYVLGYASSNSIRDGRFRHITVKLRSKAAGLKVEAREGYYADRDYAHTARADRQAELQEQLMAAIPATDVPMFVAANWFRLAGDRYFVSISVLVPASALPPSADKVTLEMLGYIRDERGLPVGSIRDTLSVPPRGDQLEARQVLYQTSLTLPPGRFTAKVVAREGVNGAMGSFEAAIVVPELKRAPVKLSSVVLSTQVRAVTGRSRNENPLVRDGVELLPNLTHVVRQDQKLLLYYEVYDPAMRDGSPRMLTSLTFYRGKTKIYTTAVVQRTLLDAPARRAVLFQFEVPPSVLDRGLYTCQINVIDAVAERFEFPRFDLYVR